MPDDGRGVDLAARVAALEAAVARLEARQVRALHPADAERLAGFLQAVAGACGDRCWSLPDLAALALVDGHRALADALAAIVGDSSNLRSPGRWLRRVAGVEIGGLTLERVGTGRDGGLYCVRVSVGSTTA